MPQVTQLKPQKNGKRVNVYLDEEFGFGIDLDNLVRFGIKVDKQYSDQEIQEIIKKAEYQKSLDKLLRFAMLRPRSTYEVKQWFRKREIPTSLQEGLITKIVSLELLDDKKFAIWWIQQRRSFKNKGNQVLKAELRSKGISDYIIEDVLSENPVDEELLASSLLTKKFYKWQGLDPEDQRKKATDFLLRNGFDWQLAKKIVESHTKQKD